MRTAFIFDTETTGLPDWKKPSGDDVQPHLVQLGALLVDLDKQEIIKMLDVIIKPDGWEIPQEVSDIHGITTEEAMKHGIPESEALMMLLDLWDGAKRVCYNRTFDKRIIRIATKRYCSEEVIEAWADKDNFDCAMMMAKPIVKATNGFKADGSPKIKNPKLAEAYEYFMGEALENAHNALVDATACMDIYFKMLDGAK